MKELNNINGWKIAPGESVPKECEDYIESHNAGVFKYTNHYLEIWSKDEEWVIVTGDGGFYKVGAQYMIWHPHPEHGMVAQAVWSFEHLIKSLESLFMTGETLPDPDYQT